MSAVRAWRTAAWVAAVVGAAATVASAQGGVRPLEARGARLLDEGMRRSPTMRSIVEELRRSDVVVYLDLDVNEPGALEGSLRFRAATAQARYVRVWLQPRRCDRALLVVLAHELQHAVEVARAADVRSAETFKAMYAAAGRSENAGHFETAAAQEIGTRVRRELEK